MLHNVDESHSAQLSDLLEGGWAYLGKHLSLKARYLYSYIADQINAVLFEVNHPKHFVCRCRQARTKPEGPMNVLLRARDMTFSREVTSA